MKYVKPTSSSSLGNTCCMAHASCMRRSIDRDRSAKTGGRLLVNGSRGKSIFLHSRSGIPAVREHIRVYIYLGAMHEDNNYIVYLA